MSIDVRQVDVPSAWDEDTPAGRDFRELTDVRNAVVRGVWDGDTQHHITHREAHGTARNQEDERIIYLGAWLDGRLVARGYVGMGTKEALDHGDFDVMVLPDARNRGVGTAVWEAASALFTAGGRTIIQAWVDHRPRPGAVLSPPNGVGSIPADTSEVRFLQRAGFTLRQVERMSALELDDARARLAALRADAEAHAADYEVLTWTAPTDPELLDGLAALTGRMATDVPAGALDIDAEEWDADRIRRQEQTEVDRGRDMLRAVAVHRATGEHVAFTTLVVPPEPDRPVYQHDTLVHADHRGHRLGMLVKIANLQQLDARLPGRSRVITWNAEENRPMLRVNEAIGFRAIGYEGAWQRDA